MDAIKSSLKRIAKVYDMIEMNFLIIFTALIGILIIVEIILRAFSVSSFKWIEEGGRYMLITTTMVGCSVAVKTKGHAVMDLVLSSIPVRMAHILRIIVNLMCGLGFLYMSYYSVIWTKELVELNRSMESITFPLWPVWVVVSIAFITTGFRFLFQIENNVKDFKNNAPLHVVQKEM